MPMVKVGSMSTAVLPGEGAAPVWFRQPSEAGTSIAIHYSNSKSCPSAPSARLLRYRFFPRLTEPVVSDVEQSDLRLGLLLCRSLDCFGCPRPSPRQERGPAQLLCRIVVAKSFFYSHFRNGIHDPLEVLPAHGVDIGIGCRIEEVDGVWDTIFYRKLDRVQIVTQCSTEGLRIFHNPVKQLGIGRRGILHIALVMRPPRIVVHDMHLLLLHHIAAKILFELDSMLQGHAQVARLVVMMEELLRRVNLVHVLPSAAGVRFEESGKADILENLFPVQWIHQVSHGLISRAFGMLLVRQNHGRRNSDAQLRR